MPHATLRPRRRGRRSSPRSMLDHGEGGWGGDGGGRP